MSNIAVWTWRDAVRKAKVPTYTKALCWALANYMSDAGEACWPSIETLMDDTGMSRRAVTDHLAKAQKAGLLDARRERNDRGHLGPYKFHPRFPKGFETPKAIKPERGGVTVAKPHAPSASRPKQPHASGAESTRTKCVSSNISTSELSKEDTREIEGCDRRITKDTLQKIELMGVDAEPLIDKMRTSGKTYHNPNRYLLKMASTEAAEKHGVSQAVVERMASSDMQTRAQAMVAAVVASTSPKPYAAKPSAALLASLGRAAA